LHSTSSKILALGIIKYFSIGAVPLFSLVVKELRYLSLMCPGKGLEILDIKL